MLKYCKCCGRNFETLTRDHIVPKSLVGRMYFAFGLSKKYSTFSGNVENYRMICKECNQSKKNKLDWTEPYTREFMEQVMLSIQKKLLLHKDDMPFDRVIHMRSDDAS